MARKAVTMYLSEQDEQQLAYLIDYFNRPGAKAGITSVYRFALDELYRSVMSEQSDKKDEA